MKPIHIVDRLDIVIGLDGPPRRLSSVIEQELISHFGLPAIQAAEQAERFEPAVAKLIRNRQFECEQNGTIAALTLLGSSAHRPILWLVAASFSRRILQPSLS